MVKCPAGTARTGGGVVLYGSGNKVVTMSAPEGADSWNCAGHSNVAGLEVKCSVICCRNAVPITRK